METAMSPPAPARDSVPQSSPDLLTFPSTAKTDTQVLVETSDDVSAGEGNVQVGGAPTSLKFAARPVPIQQIPVEVPPLPHRAPSPS